jgi:hypothetical protein
MIVRGVEYGKYGSRALAYSLLGNGNLKLCVPKKRPQ